MNIDRELAFNGRLRRLEYAYGLLRAACLVMRKAIPRAAGMARRICNKAASILARLEAILGRTDLLAYDKDCSVKWSVFTCSPEQGRMLRHALDKLLAEEEQGGNRKLKKDHRHHDEEAGLDGGGDSG